MSGREMVRGVREFGVLLGLEVPIWESSRVGSV